MPSHTGDQETSLLVDLKCVFYFSISKQFNGLETIAYHTWFPYEDIAYCI